MLKEVRLPYTAYGDLKEGDEFIRVGNRPVLISDVDGRRDGPLFYPISLGNRFGFDYEHPYRISRMYRTPTETGWLKEIDLCSVDETYAALMRLLSWKSG